MDTVLFEPIHISGLELKNRFVRSATFEGMGTFEGRPTERLKDLYFRLAEGGVGLIVTGLAHVDGYKNLPNIEGLPFPLAMDDDTHINDWTEIVEGVHERGAKIAMQLTHLGRQDIPQLREPIAPSAVPLEKSHVIPREMTVDEIHELVDKFARSCGRAKEAGFDAVQLHGCHGYLISNFISPYANRRSDKYGGSTENRTRFVREILEKAKELAGHEFPILMKMNGDDFLFGGLEIEEAVRVAQIIVEAGIDAVEMSGGTDSDNPSRISVPGIRKPEDEAYFKSFASKLKQQIEIPVLLVGGNRSHGSASKLVASGITDLISMSRPFIREPHLIKRWKDGDLRKSRCISCNRCRENLTKHPLQCYEEMPLGEKNERHLSKG